MSRYEKSERQLKRAEITIPLGSQTFSKSRTQYPVGISPLYLDRGRGAHVWDIDGNKYIDLVSALASITLGYRNRRVDQAIRRQLRKGISLSLPARLEAEVSEKLVEMIPSAEMVRFGKNGSDATSAAIRLARAYTGRDHVLVCGYHGWQDWYIGSTTRNKGVPNLVSSLTLKFSYNDLKGFNEIMDVHGHDVAAVIMEPMNSQEPLPGFLEAIKNLTNKSGALLIFDETITGFRFAKGGAQELFGVTPDLSTFGKGMANGMPLSAVVGRRDVMMEMENIFFSGTFGGELLSLAAANEVLDQYANEDLPRKLSAIGESLAVRVENIVDELKLNHTLELSGHATWKFLNWHETAGYSVNEIKTYFMQEMFDNGVLVLGSHNINLMHTPRVIDRISNTYREVLSKLSQALGAGTLRQQLKVSPLEPLFKVR
jgi:glutamate-1-semialdehyde 2,1-aminomutase